MEDEVQLQSLAKRLINIYNACKYSTSKLRLRKKKRRHQNTEDRQHFEEFTEVETEGSARTVFVYRRGNRRKVEETSDISDEESAALRKYLEEKLERNNILLEQYYNDQLINVCTCKKCCCDTEGQPCPRYEIIDKKNKGADNKKTSKIIICVKPHDKKQEEPNSKKNTPKSCCCGTQQNFVPAPPVKKKSNMKEPKQPNRDGLCQCQCPPESEDAYEPAEEPPVCFEEPFCPYYPAPLPPPKPQNTKAATCQCCPPPPRCCCSYPPTPPISSCCQCSPPTPPENLCCDCSPPSSAGCCQCKPSPVNTGCCQCEPPPPASLGCQCYNPPPPPRLCYCDMEEMEDFPPEENYCRCQTHDANGRTVIHADKIIIPTCYFNEGDQGTESGNLSGAISEEVKNELLNDSSFEKQMDDKEINTSCLIIRSCTSSYRRANAPQPEPEEAFVPCTCTKKDVAPKKELPPEPKKKEFEPKPKAPEPKPKPPEPKKKEAEPKPKPPEQKKNAVTATSSCKKPPVCCKCQQKIPSEQRQPPPPQNQPPPPQHPPPPLQHVPSPPPQHPPPPHQPAYHPPPPPHQPAYHPQAHPSAYNSVYPAEEKMIAKHSPRPFSDHQAPKPAYASNYVGSPYAVAMAPARITDHTAALRSTSTPVVGVLCPNLASNGDGDGIAGINENTEAEIFATLQKIEITLRDEADMHSRNMRCIVDTVCKQAGEIKELKVLVTGVVEEKKAPSCKEVEKKIKKLDKKKEKEAKKQRERELKERERQKEEAREKGLEVIPSNLCCKCADKKKKRPKGCCGKCCAKRCFGCCGKFCGGCCAKCCDIFCFPCEKCCPLCCVFARWCDYCCSCRCCKRKKKCKCSK